MKRLLKISLPLAPTAAWTSAILIIFLLIITAAPLYSQASLYDEEWRWVSFTTESHLPSDRVENIVETSAGIVWAQTAGGIAWYDGYQWIPCDSTKGLPALPYRIIGEGFGDSILVSANNGLYSGDKNGFRLVLSKPITEAVTYIHNAFLILSNLRLSILDHGNLRPINTTPKLSDVNVYNIWRTKGGTIWINSKDGLFTLENDRLSPQLFANALRFQINTLAENNEGMGFTSISGPLEQRGMWEWEDHGKPRKSLVEKGELLKSADIDPNGRAIALHQSGELRIRSYGRWYTLSSLPFSLNNTTFVKFRANGDLWVGTERGLFLYKQSSSRWTFKKHDAPDPRNRIHEILRASNGDLWLATAEGIEIQKPNGEIKTITEINGNKLWEVTGLAQDDAGIIWISSGYGFEGAYRWDGRQWRGGGGPSSVFFHKIRKDKSGNLWFLGLSRSDVPYEQDTSGAFEFSGGKLTHWGLREGLSNGRVYSFAEGTDGALWFGTYNGLNKWKNGTWSHWTVKEGLKDSRIFCLTVDRSNIVWFGDQQNGLGSIDDKGVVKYYTTEDGLVDNRIWDLKVDAKGKLWIATEAGLGSYYKGTWSTFDTRTGLNNPSLWPVLPFGDKVYVGTIGGGLAVLNVTEAVQPPPHIVLYPPFNQSGTTLLRWLPLAYWGELPSKDIMTRYRIDGSQWSGWDTRRELELTDLSNGMHTFEIQAKGLFGNFNENGETKVCSIGVPFYKEAMYLIPVSILIIAVAAYSILSLSRKKKQESRLLESESKFSAVTETTSSAIFILQNNSFRYLNKGTALLTGYRSEELLHSDFSAIVHPEFRHLLEKGGKAKPGTEGMLPRYELKINAKNGEERWIDYTTVEIVYEGKPASLGTAFDITERKAAEDALRWQQVEERVILDYVPALIWYKDKENRIIHLNKTAADALGKKTDDVKGKSMYELFPDRGAQYHADDLEIIKSGNPKFGIIELFPMASGEQRWVQTDKIPYRTEDGTITGVIVFAQDITERRRVDMIQSAVYKIEKVVETSKQPEAAFASIHSIIKDVLPANNFTIALCSTEEDAVSFPYVADEKEPSETSRKRRKGLIEYVFQTGESLLCTVDRLKELERLGKVKIYGAPFSIWLGIPIVADEKPIGVIALKDYSDPNAYGERERQIMEFVSSQVANILQRKRFEEILRQSDDRYRELFEESEDAILIASPSGQLVDINQAGLRLFGYETREELLRINVARDLFVEPEKRVVQQWQHGEAGNVKNLETRVKRKDGSHRIVLETTRVIRDKANSIVSYRSVLRDITEKKQLEERVSHSPKDNTIEAAATVPPKVAADVSTESKPIETRVEEKAELPQQTAPTMVTQSPGNEIIVEELSPPSQEISTPAGVVNLRDVILDLKKFVETNFPRTINFDWRMDAGISAINDDQNQVYQCLENLCTNARDSMPNGGLLSVEVRAIDGVSIRERHPRALSDHYICIQVIDTGSGMDSQTRQRIFEPLANSKEIGSDTGNGLEFVFSVIRKYNGFIEVESAENVGTMFTLFFPAPETNGESQKRVQSTKSKKL
jgi:PAS domain S-box-containing protein